MLRYPSPAMPAEAAERLGAQLAAVTVDCSDAQLLQLADMLHDMIRDRRELIHRWRFEPSERRFLEVPSG